MIPSNLLRIWDRKGVTIIELLTTIGILGLIVALLLPAVQSARDAARRVHCASNLRQVNLALQHYQQVHTLFPAIAGYPKSPRQRSFEVNQYSVFARILPYMDQANIYHNVNFSGGLQDPYLFDELAGNRANSTVMSIQLNLLLCPADRVERASKTRGTNYRVNIGSRRWVSPQADTLGGPLNAYGNASPAVVNDGFSNTVAFGEKLRGRGRSSRLDPRTDMVLGFVLGDEHSPDEALSYCASKHGSPNGYLASAGLCWFVGSLAHTSYNHLLEPNSRIADCVILANPVYGLLGARSNHLSGVYVGMLDGSVRFVNDSIQYSVWRAIGTRSGGELLMQGGL